MTEFEVDEVFGELNRKFANVSLEYNSKKVRYEDLQYYKNQLENSTNSYDSYFEAIKNIRRYLTQNISLERIQDVLNLGLQGKLKQVLEVFGYDELKYETAWTITNLAYGTKEQTANLIESGIIESLIYCFQTTDNYRVKSQSAWALANVSIDSPDYRENMAKLNLIGQTSQALLTKVTTTQNITRLDYDDIKDLTWSLSNLCRGGFKTIEHWEQYIVAFEAFSHSLQINIQDIWYESCWGLSRILSNMYNHELFYTQVNLHTNLCFRLVELLRNDLQLSSMQMLPVLQTLSNFSSGPNEYIDMLIDANILEYIGIYISPNTNPQLKRNAILTISNFAASSENTVKKVIDNDCIMKAILSHINIPGHTFNRNTFKWLITCRETKEDWKVLKESLWVISNMVTLGNDAFMKNLLNNYSNLVELLTGLFYYPALPLNIAFKLLDILTKMVMRTENLSKQILNQGIVPTLAYLCKETQSKELIEQSHLFYQTLTQEHNQFTTTFGLEGPNTRRIVYGCEDGDVRFIENAMNNIQL